MGKTEVPHNFFRKFIEELKNEVLWSEKYNIILCNKRGKNLVDIQFITYF